MPTGRLFTFGCSLTAYKWPTWADILGQHWDFYENWAQPGAGNTFIFNSLIECDTRNKFTSNDTILVMWSGVARIDYYQINCWSHKINSFSKNSDTLPYSCPEGYEILSYPLIQTIDQLFSQRHLNYKFYTWSSYDKTSRVGQLYKDSIDRIKEIKFDCGPKTIKTMVNFDEVLLLYKRLAGPEWPTFDEILENNYNIKSEEIQKEVFHFEQLVKNDPYFKLKVQNVVDNHPLPLDHFKVIEQMLPDFKIKSSVVDWLQDIEIKINNGQSFSFHKHFPKERL